MMIVVLRKLYEEQAERLSLAADPVVTVGEVREEYRTVTGKERVLGITQYEEILKRLKRLGLVEPRTSAEKAHEVLGSVVPEEAIYDLHVNMVAHVRQVCHARQPRCELCVLAPLCDYLHRGR